jgi:hypothetical protein
MLSSSSDLLTAEHFQLYAANCHLNLSIFPESAPSPVTTAQFWAGRVSYLVIRLSLIPKLNARQSSQLHALSLGS